MITESNMTRCPALKLNVKNEKITQAIKQGKPIILRIDYKKIYEDMVEEIDINNFQNYSSATHSPFRGDLEEYLSPILEEEQEPYNTIFTHIIETNVVNDNGFQLMMYNYNYTIDSSEYSKNNYCYLDIFTPPSSSPEPQT